MISGLVTVVGLAHDHMAGVLPESFFPVHPSYNSLVGFRPQSCPVNQLSGTSSLVKMGYPWNVNAKFMAPNELQSLPTPPQRQKSRLCFFTIP